jgi:hypothetical protein
VEDGLVLAGRKPTSPPKAKKSKRKDMKVSASKGKKRFGKKGKRR